MISSLVSIRAVKAGAVAGALVCALLGSVGPASAATVHHSSVNPKGACNGDPGPFADVLDNLGTVYHVVSGPNVDDNGTGSNATDSFSNTFSGTVSATISAGLEAKEGVVLEDVKATLGVSATVSATISGSHTITYTIAPHTALHAEYAEDQISTEDKTYLMNDNCAEYDIVDGYSSFDEGSGRHTWSTAY